MIGCMRIKLVWLEMLENFSSGSLYVVFRCLKKNKVKQFCFSLKSGLSL